MKDEILYFPNHFKISYFTLVLVVNNIKISSFIATALAMISVATETVFSCVIL